MVSFAASQGMNRNMSDSVLQSGVPGFGNGTGTSQTFSWNVPSANRTQEPCVDNIAPQSTLLVDTNRPICNVCGKSFATKSSWSEHIKLHMGKYRYTCPQCGKGFRVKTHFEGHMNSHMNLRPFCCRLCNKSFSYRQSFLRHEANCVLVTSQESE